MKLFVRPFRVLAFFTTLIAACDCGSGSGTGTPCTSTTECGSGMACVSNRCAPTDGGGATDANDGATVKDGSPDVVVIDTSISGITITQPPATLDVTIGAPNSSLTFVVTASLASGGTMTIDHPILEVDNYSPGVVSDNTYIANGAIGGTVTVTATVVAANGTFTAEATFSIRLVSTTNPSLAVVFGTAPVTDMNADAEILYPLHQAVMPQNVQPADLQWACDASGTPCPNADVFRVTISKPNLLVTHYVPNDASNMDGSLNDHLLPSVGVWRAIAQTDPASPAVFSVDRYQASMNRVVRGVNTNVTFAPTAITGTVYYWNIDRRRILAIEDGTSTSTNLLPYIDSPVGGTPDFDMDNTGNDDTCVGCHSVSPSGRYMLANMHSANYGALFDLTNPTLSTTRPTHSEFPGSMSIRWRLSSWSPDERYAMVSTTDNPDALRLINPFNGNTITPTKNASGVDTALPTNGTMPSWARDNSAIAYISNANDWSGQTTTGDLWRLGINDLNDFRFDAPTQMRAASTLITGPETNGWGGNHGIFYPSHSPDSQWLAFAHGTSSRSDPRDWGGGWNAIDFAHTSSIYLARANGTQAVRLARGTAATVVPEQKPGSSATTMRRGLDFQPNFAPFQGGGYFWLSFLSRRPYGNNISGNRDMTIHPGQIWVMAVRVDANGTLDPSEVAYRLPGQYARERAVSAFWAPRPCRANGTECDVGGSCCSGDCRPPVGADAGAASVCSPPPPAMCRQIGQTCNVVADCCGSATNPAITCSGNVCVQVVIID